MNNIRINKSEGFYQATAIFDTESERDAFIGNFPKFVKVVPNVLSSLVDGKSQVKPIAYFQVALSATALTGNANETGIKRIAKFEEILEKVGA